MIENWYQKILSCYGWISQQIHWVITAFKTLIVIFISFSFHFLLFIFFLAAEAYSEPGQTSKREHLGKFVFYIALRHNDQSNGPIVNECRGFPPIQVSVVIILKVWHYSHKSLSYYMRRYRVRILKRLVVVTFGNTFIAELLFANYVKINLNVFSMMSFI